MRLWPALTGVVMLAAASLSGCATVPPERHAPGGRSVANSDADNGTAVIVYVARRGWHIDVGLDVNALDALLSPLRDRVPKAKFLFFGFGDRRYLTAGKKNAPVLLQALWPGPALVLLTAIDGEPAEAFGATNVIALRISSGAAQALQAFIRDTISSPEMEPLAAGPYDGSLYFAARQRYSAIHTCNTWAAQALRAAQQPLRSAGVVFAGQLWAEVRRLVPPPVAVPVQQRSGSAQATRAAVTQLQGGLVPS